MKSLLTLFILLNLVACNSTSDEFTFEDTSDNETNNVCSAFENLTIGNINLAISGSNATIDWDNDLASADNFVVNVDTSPSQSLLTKPVSLNAIANGNYTATIIYSKLGCSNVESSRNFIIDTSVDCTAWDAATIASTINTTPTVGNVTVDWSGGTITGQDSFSVTVSGNTADQTITDIKPANFNGMLAGSHTATIRYVKTGCSDKTQSSAAFVIPTSFSTDVLPTLTTCNGCHGSSGGYTASLYSEYTAESTSVCGSSEFRVIPGDSINSAFYKKITGSSCGSEMGTGGFGTLSTAQKLVIQTWIDEGALDN